MTDTAAATTAYLNDSPELRIRNLWKEGSLCRIYSRSKKCWYNGKILQIINDSEGEWLKVRYNETHCKYIQRLCKDIKPETIKTNMKAVCSYIENKKIFDEILICGYLRLQTHYLIPSVIINLCLQCFHKKIVIFEFNLKRILGTGTFGIVRLCQHKETRKEYAIKILDKKRLIEMKQEKHIENECEILKETRLKHPFIISLLLSFEDINYVYLAFELLPMGCEFFDLLQTYNGLSVTQCVFYSSQIVLIFEYLHSKNIIYRDLKPENLMYSNDGYLKLIDFGFSTKLHKNANYLTKTLCGTPDYLAPEMILSEEGYSVGVDWWSLGILIFEMFTGFTPFEADDVVTIYTNIISHNIGNIVNTHSDIQNQHLKDIVCGLLSKNPKNRLGKNSLNNDINDIKSHPFFQIIDWNKIYNKQYTNTPKHSAVKKMCHQQHKVINHLAHHSYHYPFVYDF